MGLQGLCDKNFRKFLLDRAVKRGCTVDNFPQKVGITKSVDNSVDNVDILKKRALGGIHALYPAAPAAEDAGKPRKTRRARRQLLHKNAQALGRPCGKWG